MSRIRWAAAAIAACAAIAAVGATAVAATKTDTMHFFAKRVYTRMSDGSGRKLPSNFVPTAGDRVSWASDYYSGDHNHHAKKATASDKSVCTVISPSGVLCDGIFAIGGSVIIADDYMLRFPVKKPEPVTIKITGGTGRYQGARGTISAVAVGNSVYATDVTITLASESTPTTGHRR
jgi:hypothetical protein